MSTISKPKTIDGFISKFVIKTIPTNIVDSEYESLNKMTQALYVNVATLTKTLDGGNMLTSS